MKKVGLMAFSFFVLISLLFFYVPTFHSPSTIQRSIVTAILWLMISLTLIQALLRQVLWPTLPIHLLILLLRMQCLIPERAL